MDFLTFKSFISTEVLIAFYYIGAIIFPALAWYLVTWLLYKYDFANALYQKGNKALWKSLSKNQQYKLILFFLATFLFMELFWRMLFEFLIAYMQIRDALLQSQL